MPASIAGASRAARTRVSSSARHGRALLARPKLMMLDEPSLGLSPLLVERLFKLIVDLRAEGLAILLVEQNTQMALDIASRGLVMELGNVVLQGTADVLRNDRRLADAYLGSTHSYGT